MQYAFGDIEVNTGTQELVRDGEPVHVERQVLAVLLYLIEHRERVVPKIELLDEIWESRFVSESALTSRIKSARQACGDNGRDQAVIRTIHGVGYRFVADVSIADHLAPAAPPPPAAAARPSRAGGLIGRRREVGDVEAAMARAAQGQRAAAFITGPAGIGKSTFLAEIVERIDDETGWQLLRGQTLPPRGAVEPFFPILDALSRAARAGNDAVAAAIDRVAPMWLAQIPSLVEHEQVEQLERRLLGVNPDRMLREGAELLEELARTGPVALVLEDLHWADQSTIDVIDLALQRTEPCRLVILASSRTEHSPVDELIRSRSGTGHAVHVELGGLDDDDIDRLVIDEFDGAEVSGELLDVVRRRSGGIPLFALEVVRGWRRLGYITVDDGTVRLTRPPDELESLVPDNLRQLVEHDLAHLDVRTTQLLEMAAVVGTEFDAAAVAAALARPVDEVDAELTTMARLLHQINAVGGSRWPDGTSSTRFEFGHDVFRQVLHDRLPINRSAGAHAAIGLAMEAGFTGRTEEIAGRLAEHFVAAGDHGRAVEYLRIVGERSVKGNAFAAATSALLDAVAHVEQLPTGADRDRAELQVRLALGPALAMSRGWFGEGVAENYERALALCSASGPCSEASLARYGLATVTELRGEYARTEQLLAPMIPDSIELAVEAKELMACSAFHQGKFELSFDLATTVVNDWDGEYASEAMSRIAEHPVSSCYSWASLAAWCLGKSEESLDLATKAVDMGEQHLYALSTALVQRAFLHQLRREADDCRQWAERSREIALAQGFPMRAMQAEMLLGWADAMSGDDNGAERIRVAMTAFVATGARLSEPYFLGLLAESELALGRPEQAAEMITEAISKMTVGSRTFFAGPELHRIAAAALGACGKDDEAMEQIRLAVDEARELESPVLEVRALVDGLRRNDEPVLRARLVELTDELDSDEGRDLSEARALLCEPSPDAH